MKMGKLTYIDSLKGLAILGILILHSSQYGTGNNFPSFIQSAIGHGARGVQLFFIISAFTLFNSFHARIHTEKHPVRNFVIRRFFRIAPLYYVGIAYYLWQDGTGQRFWLGDAPSISIANIFSNIFLVHGLNPYWMNSVVPGGWAITIEVLFYCFAPFLFSRIKSSTQALNFVVISLWIRLLFFQIFKQYSFIQDERLWNAYLFFYFPNQLPVFALGILMYYVIRDEHKIVFPPLATLLIALMLIIDFAANMPLFYPHHILFGISFVFLGTALSNLNVKFILNPFFIHLGKISYSIYLMHYAVMFWLSRYGLVDFMIVTDTLSAVTNYSIRLLLLIITTTVVATVSHEIIEKPFRHIGNLLIDRLEKKDLMTVA